MSKALKFNEGDLVLVTVDVHYTDDDDHERIAIAPSEGKVLSIDQRESVTIYEIEIFPAGWFLYEPMADGETAVIKKAEQAA